LSRNLLKKFLEQEIDEEELDKNAETKSEKLLDKKVCHADGVFEFYKLGFRNALGV
jgi:hypothetical protein